MKKVLLSLLLAVFLPLQACAQEQWKKGEHYQVINENASAEKEVLEFFSFWCPHCYSFEPLVKEIKSQLDEDVKFKKVHANFMGSTSAKIQDDATRAMMIGKALKKELQLNDAIFRHIHVQRGTITGLKDLQNIFLANGVSPEDFDKMAKSFSVNSLVQQNKKTQATYRKHLTGVPSFIVNGKFKAIFTRDMTADDMVDLIVWLTKQK
jgi:thiol:disulfide interchange protein DsbA